MPPQLQAELFVRILSFDRSLQASAGRDVVVGVAVQRGYRASLEMATAFVAAVEALGEPSASEPRLHAVLVEMDGGELGPKLDRLGVEVLYLSPLRAVSIEEVAAAARSRGIRTLTGVPTYVRLGISIGLSVRESQPEILVNLPAARAEGADLSSQLLGLAKVSG